MRPCSQFWIVIQVTCSGVNVAFQTADTGAENLIQHDLINKITSKILHLNKIQNQEFLLHEIVDSKVCPKELLIDRTTSLDGKSPQNSANLPLMSFPSRVIYHVTCLLTRDIPRDMPPNT